MRVMTKEEQEAFRVGAASMLRRYGVWRDGDQYINDRLTAVLESEVARWDLEDLTVDQASVLVRSGAGIKDR